MILLIYHQNVPTSSNKMSNKMYTITIFKDLIAKYPNWNDLKTYLQSDEGGKLMITESSGVLSQDNVIIHYKKDYSDMAVKHTKWFKSVVWDTIRNIPISVSTPKSEEDDPTKWDSISYNYVVEEYLEGVTFNAYYCEKDANMNIASRTKFGATGKFYSNKSFNEMILEALKKKDETYTTDILKNLFIQLDSTKHISSFITLLLQHPEHIVVEHVSDATLYLLQTGVVNKDGTVEISENSQNIIIESLNISHSKPYENQTIPEWFVEISKSKKWDWRGVVVKDSEGNRWRIKSPFYNMIRNLRGNTSRSDERFFNLRSQGLVKQYLTYYPEESNTFWGYEKWIRKATNDLFGLYIGVNKAKTIGYNDVDPLMKAHITALQMYYYSVLKPIGKTVVKENVIVYMNALPVPRLLYMMNFNKRDVEISVSTAN